MIILVFNKPHLKWGLECNKYVIKVNLLTKWKGWTGKYLARGHAVQTERSELRAPTTKDKIISCLARPKLSQ